MGADTSRDFLERLTEGVDEMEFEVTRLYIDRHSIRDAGFALPAILRLVRDDGT